MPGPNINYPSITQAVGSDDNNRKRFGQNISNRMPGMCISGNTSNSEYFTQTLPKELIERSERAKIGYKAGMHYTPGRTSIEPW